MWNVNTFTECQHEDIEVEGDQRKHHGTMDNLLTTGVYYGWQLPLLCYTPSAGGSYGSSLQCSGLVGHQMNRP